MKADKVSSLQQVCRYILGIRLVLRKDIPEAILVLEGDIAMKKVSFRLRNFDKEQFLTFNIDNDAQLDEDVLDFIEDEEPIGIVPVIFEEEEDFDTFSYNITDKIRLSELSNQEINAEMVLMVLRGLALSLINMAEYRIPLSYLVLHRKYIYIDSEYNVEFVCVPLEEMQEEVDMNHFLRSFIASLRFDTSENGDYVAKLLTFINNPALFNLRELVTVIEDLMENMGIEVPEDNPADIYVDYQEVDEDEAAAASENLVGDTTILKEDDKNESETDMVDAVEDSKKEEENDIEEPEQEEENSVEEPKQEEENSVEESEQEEENGVEESEEEDGEVEPEEKTGTEEPEDSLEAIVEEQEDIKDGKEEKTTAVQEDSLEDDELEEAQAIIEILKNKVNESKAAADGEEEESKKTTKKPMFKTKDTSVKSVVIQDELDEYLAEKEKEEEEKEKKHEESSLKIKKNIKVNRAGVLKGNQDEIKESEDKTEEAEVTEVEEEEVVSNSILSQTIGTTGILKGADVPKANPYLIRVNTDERIMITKSTFKIGKASMGVDYTVKGNSAVSRLHAVITSKDGVYYVKDNKSTNHTFVNGKMLNDGDNELLTHDCKIVLGDEEFVFKLR